MSKSRGPTKAEQILIESKNRVSDAYNKLVDANDRVASARAVHDALQDAHYALERTLTATKRKREKKAAPTVDVPKLALQTGTGEWLNVETGKNGAKATGKKAVTEKPDGVIVGAP